MARKSQAPLLDMGDAFPRLELTLTSGKRSSLPAELSKPFNVVLVNRGALCPFCIGKLEAFQAGLGTLTEESIGLVSFSAESREKAGRVVADKGLEFPVGCEASVDGTAEALVLSAVYNSAAIGRLVWQDGLGLVRYIKSHA